ncbi:MAG: hypothetical protein M1417_01570 [Candidatus Thermoplasmatota archaeon]|nr:hypothetical protein [Candidatus Thermoplasmatota archaeon]
MDEMVVINLWNPSNVDFISALIISFLLGIVHGITPDEHTWPITFSYSVSQRGSRGGARAGMIFATGFTIQRSILSELAYFALAGIFLTSLSFGLTLHHGWRCDGGCRHIFREEEELFPLPSYRGKTGIVLPAAFKGKR